MYGAMISHSVSEVSDGQRRGRFTATHPPIHPPIKTSMINITIHNGRWLPHRL